jgi:glycerol-3-phosphate O-acyltransferase
MTNGVVPQSYEPNAALAYLYRRFFDHIKVEEGWVRAVRDAASTGNVVFVLRNQSFVDFLALDHLTKRFNLPPIRFAQDLGLWILEPMGRGWLSAAFRRTEPSVEDRLRDALSAGGSGVLFLKRPPTILEGARGVRGRGISEGDEALRAILRLQRTRERPILLVPQTFVWTKRPDRRGAGALDLLFGPRDWPGMARTVSQALMNYRNVDFRAGEVLDLQALLADAEPGENDDALVRRITYALLTRVERERRAILGPAKKGADRVRDEVIRSPKLQSVISDLAGEGPAQRLLLTAKAYGMLRELEAAPAPEAHKAFELALDVLVHTIYAGIEVDEAGLERVREAGKRGTVVFLPSHKSHVDYLMLSYVLNAAHLHLPLIAAGDNLSFFPMGPIFRRGGAFFIRRSFKGDRLYAAVVDAYLRRLVRDGWAIEFFLEGGRSRTGKLLPPKFGLLNIICDAALSLPDRQVTFMPVSIGYDRIVEERSYVRESTGGEKRKEDARALLRSTRVLGGFYGRVNVQFGEPLTLQKVASDLGVRGTVGLTPGQRRTLVTRLAHQAMAEINRVTSVTPGAVAALALLDGTRHGIPHLELVEACRRIVATLSRRGARMARTLVHSTGTMRPDAVRDAAQLWVKGELVEAHVPGEGLEGKQRARAAIYTGDDVVYTVPDTKRLSLSLSKNIIIHLFVSRALVATALRVENGPPLPESTVEERVRTLSRIFKFEFMFRADAPFEVIFRETLAAMIEEGDLARLPSGELTYGEGHDGESGEGWIRFYADVLRPYVAGYVIAARALQLLTKGPMTSKDLAKRALVTGERMYLAGEITRREAVSRPILENAILALLDQQYLHQSEGKLSLAPSFEAPEMVGTAEVRLRPFLCEEAPLVRGDKA